MLNLLGLKLEFALKSTRYNIVMNKVSKIVREVNTSSQSKRQTNNNRLLDPTE